jgi:hypothetical protein
MSKNVQPMTNMVQLVPMVVLAAVADLVDLMGSQVAVSVALMTSFHHFWRRRCAKQSECPASRSRFTISHEVEIRRGDFWH